MDRRPARRALVGRTTVIVIPMYDQSKQSELIRFVSAAIAEGVPAPVFGSALAYYDELREKRSPANLVQGLRDEFGALGYRPFDRDGKCHTDWGRI